MRWSTVTSLNKQTNVQEKGADRRLIFSRIQEPYPQNPGGYAKSNVCICPFIYT